MAKQEKKTEVVEEPQKKVGLNEATLEQLEAFAFRTEQQIKVTQRDLQTIFDEINKRATAN